MEDVERAPVRRLPLFSETLRQSVWGMTGASMFGMRDMVSSSSSLRRLPWSHPHRGACIDPVHLESVSFALARSCLRLRRDDSRRWQHPSTLTGRFVLPSCPDLSPSISALQSLPFNLSPSISLNLSPSISPQSLPFNLSPPISLEQSLPSRLMRCATRLLAHVFSTETREGM